MTAHIYNKDIAEYSETAWHGKGHVHDGEFTPMEVIADFPQFERRPTYVQHGMGLAQTGTDAIVRVDDPTEIMNPCVTARYGVPDYGWFDQFCIEAIDAGAVEGFSTRGTLYNGRLAYASLKIGDDIWIGDGDRLENYLTLFDGTKGIACGGKNTVARVVCKNTWDAHLTGAPVLFQEKHTTNVAERLEVAWRALLATVAAERSLRQTVEQLINESYHEWQFRDVLVPTLIGQRPDEKGRAQTNHTKRSKEINQRYWGEDLDNGLRFTKFGALMAIQGYEQHVAPRRGDDRQASHLETLLNGRQKLSTHASGILLGSLL